MVTGNAHEPVASFWGSPRGAIAPIYPLGEGAFCGNPPRVSAACTWNCLRHGGRE